MKLIFFYSMMIFIFHLSWTGYGQVTDHSNIRIDTLIVKNSDYELIHFHKVERNIYTDLLFDKDDSVFSELNKYSRMIVKNSYKEYNIPTIPFSHLYILNSKDLILGLSSYLLSPYNIVVYRLSTGELLYKSKITIFELKLTEDEISKIIAKYPGIENCLKVSNVFKINEEYYFEITNCIINILGRDSFIDRFNIVGNRYFPLIGSTTASSYDQQGKYYLKSYVGFFDLSDPLYDLIVINNVPYLLILNSDNGEKIHIPLVSNCESPIPKHMQDK